MIMKEIITISPTANLVVERKFSEQDDLDNVITKLAVVISTYILEDC